MLLGFYLFSFENYAIMCCCSCCCLCIFIRLNDILITTIVSLRKSCSCWVLAGSLLLTAASTDSWWWPNGRSFDDRKDSVAAVESEREPVASICDSFATAPHPVDDGFWLVVISVACAFHRTLRTGHRSCGKLSAADNTRDTAPAMITALNRASASCSSPLPQRCYCTSTDDWWDHLRSRPCSDTTCSAHTSSLKSCRFRSLCNLAQMHMSLYGSNLPDKTLDSIWKRKFTVKIGTKRLWRINSPTPQSSFYHRILLNYRFWYIESRSFL